MSNRLMYETSPYLLQHKDNPVDWYPWCEDAFERARAEDKPIFLSIGYSACHWCHVLAHESFEDETTAELLNRYFISIKVDKEERPDIDSVYMAVCQAFTGSGGWPTSIFMTWDQKPFFAGTYFPKTTQGGMIGFRELIVAIHDKWVNDRKVLLEQSERLSGLFEQNRAQSEYADAELLHSAVELFEKRFDDKHGGFGRAPKFPVPHNLMFLLCYYERYKNGRCLEMAEHTLIQMYKGGIFDHIGGGFCRYSTDKRFLVPHFEKMLYDNALLIIAYCKAYSVTQNELYLTVAKKTADFVLHKMRSEQGGFLSALDADSEGEEGLYYLLTPDEVRQVLGDADAQLFCRRYGITDKGNFEGKSIPNLLGSEPDSRSFEPMLTALQEYRRQRHSLHIDDKILTAWNGLMISALCRLYLVSGDAVYLDAALSADRFIGRHLLEGDKFFVSYRDGRRGVEGFLDDYAAYISAQLALHRATLDDEFLSMAQRLCERVFTHFCDSDGGFFMYSHDSERLIARPKETYDGAIPSGNSLLAYDLVRLHLITSEQRYGDAAKRLLDFIAADAVQYPIGHSMFLTALIEYLSPPTKITVVSDGQLDKRETALRLDADDIVIFLERPSEQYPLKGNKVTYYVCHSHSCLPPTNDIPELSDF